MESYADFSALNSLDPADVAVSASRKGDEIKVTMENKSQHVAFFIRMSIKDSEGELVVPAFWNDNLVSLEPGQTMTYSCKAAGDQAATLHVSGWNVAQQDFVL